MIKTIVLSFAAGYMTRWTIELIKEAWKNRHAERD